MADARRQRIELYLFIGRLLTTCVFQEDAKGREKTSLLTTINESIRGAFAVVGSRSLPLISGTRIRARGASLGVLRFILEQRNPCFQARIGGIFGTKFARANVQAHCRGTSSDTPWCCLPVHLRKRSVVETDHAAQKQLFAFLLSNSLARWAACSLISVQPPQRGGREHTHTHEGNEKTQRSAAMHRGFSRVPKDSVNQDQGNIAVNVNRKKSGSSNQILASRQKLRNLTSDDPCTLALYRSD